MNLVRGEFLINNTSRLIAFKYSVAAIRNGLFFIEISNKWFSLYVFTYRVFWKLAIFRYAFILDSIGIVDWIQHILRRATSSNTIYYWIAEEVFHASGKVMDRRVIVEERRPRVKDRRESKSPYMKLAWIYGEFPKVGSKWQDFNKNRPFVSLKRCSQGTL